MIFHQGFDSNWYSIKDIQAVGLVLSQLSTSYIHPIIDAAINSVVSDGGKLHESFLPYSYQAKFGLRTPDNSIVTLYHSVMHYASLENSHYLVSSLKNINKTLSPVQLQSIFSLAGPILLRLTTEHLFDELFTCLVLLLLNSASEYASEDFEATIALLCLARRHHPTDLPNLCDLLRPFLIGSNDIPEKILAPIFSLL